MRNRDDWFLDLKTQILLLSYLLKTLKEDMIVMLTMSNWVLEDIRLEKSFVNLYHVLEISNQDLEFLVKQIEIVEQGKFLNVTDLADEFNCTQDNIYLELEYMNHVASYIVDFNQPTFNKKGMIGKYLSQEREYLERIEENNLQLKQIREERREKYIE